MLRLIFQRDVCNSLCGLLWHRKRIKGFFKENTGFLLKFTDTGMGLSTENSYFYSVLKPASI